MNIDARQAMADIRSKFGTISDASMNKATARSMNEAITQGRTIIKRSITERYNVRSSYVSNRMMPIDKASSSNLQSTLKLSTAHIPIAKFKNVRQRKGSKKTRGGTSFEIIKGNRSFIPGAFILNGKNGIGVLHRAYLSGRSAYRNGKFQFRNKRVNKGSDTPIGQLFTLSPFSAAVNPIVMGKAKDKIQSAFASRLTYNIERIISKP